MDREIITNEPVTITLSDGTTATGMLCMSSARPGYFWVEYNGRRKTDWRCYQEPTWTQGPDSDPARASQHGYMIMMGIARIVLREMTVSNIGTQPVGE